MSIAAELDASEPRPPDDGRREDKKNYAERLSRHLAKKYANALRKDFPGILPNQDGTKQESPARSSRGLKKLDVNYSTAELGLGLGVTIKTISFKDPTSKRFTKNYSRTDNELRAEANDYHQRQPWAVLVGIIYLPASSTADGETSSFGAAVQFFRQRGCRCNPTNQEDQLERIFIGVYEPTGDDRGTDWYFDVGHNPPRNGRPMAVHRLTFDQLIERIKQVYDSRNNPPFTWATESE